MDFSDSKEKVQEEKQSERKDYRRSYLSVHIIIIIINIKLLTAGVNKPSLFKNNNNNTALTFTAKHTSALLPVRQVNSPGHVTHLSETGDVIVCVQQLRLETPPFHS